MSNTTPLGWEVSSLDQVFSEIKNGCSIDQNTSGDGIPVTRIETISQEKIDYSKVGWVKTTDDIDRFKIEKYDILLSHINSLKHIGKTAIKEDDRRLYHGMNLLRLKVCKSKFYPVYIHNLLSWEVVREEMRRKAKQAINQASLNVQDIKSLTYVLPPLPEQQKIATILSSVDDVIEKTRAQIDKLKDLKTGMMQELLTKGIGHTEFKDSPVGRIPVRWDVLQLGDICKVQGGYAFKSADAADDGCRWLKIANVGRGQVLWNDKSFLPNEFLLKHKDFILKNGDIVLALTRPVISGELKVARTTKGDVPSLLNQRVARVIPKTEVAFNDYLFALFSWGKLASDIEDEIFGTDPPNVSTKQIESMRYAIPPLDEQRLIADSISSVSNRIYIAFNKLEQLKQIKKALMQDLLTGKVRVNLTDKESAVV